MRLRPATLADLPTLRAWDEQPHVLEAAGDFAEGVRAKLVDKDGAPRWRHDRIEDVMPNEVDALFA
mgnify:CR=1 FL=1